MSVAPNGRVDVAWNDFRSDAAFHPAGDFNSELSWDVYPEAIPDPQADRLRDAHIATDGGTTPSHVEGCDASLFRLYTRSGDAMIPVR